MDRKQPNVILIMTDQQRSDTVNALGAHYMITPNIDQLVKKGRAYTHAFSPGATCVTSRAALFTGLYPHNTGVYSFDNWSHQRSWVEDLSENGYHCVNIGKMHIMPIFENIGFHERKIVENKTENFEAQGMHEDDWGWWLRMHGEKRDLLRHETDPLWGEKKNCITWDKDEKLHSDIHTGNLAVEWINSWNPKKPLFMQIGFTGPHEPYDPPERFLNLYRDTQFPERLTREGELDSKPPQHKAHQDFFSSRNNGPSQIDLREASDEEINRIRRHYSAGISLIDEKIGEIIDALGEKGLLENSVVIFTSDHGDNLGDHGMPYKWLMYDSITNVPLVITDFRNPSDDNNLKEDLVSLIDLGPTILDYCNVRIPERLEGINLNGDEKNQHVYCEDNYLIMIRDDDFKMVYYIGQDYGELYDLQKDPHEFTNLWDSSDYLQTRNRLSMNLLAWISRSSYFNKNYKSEASDSRPIRWPEDEAFSYYLHGRPGTMRDRTLN